MPPIRFGRKNTVRKTLVPLSPRVSISARAKASTLMRIVETIVNFAVNQNALTNVGSENTEK